ncbi:MAG TPA: hypothetical protein VF181_05820 [Balneolaceae bacterium]
MTREKVLKETINQLQELSKSELKEVSDFVSFLKSKLQDRELTYSIQRQAEQGNSFSFLEDEEELYSVDDLKERY